MKEASVGGVAVAVLFFAVWGYQPSLAQVPGIINFQGRVTVAGTNFTGTGSFRFELMDGTGSGGYWGNDGGIPPANPVQLPVSNGMFSVMLGDTSLAHMVAITNSVFTNSDVRLRVWFNGQQLSPDQRIAAVGYAMMAANVAGGYVDLSNTQTISGVKLLTTNLLMRQGADDSVRWGVGVGSFTDPDSVVHSNVLLFSQNGAIQLLMVPDKVLYALHDLSVEGEVDAGKIWANGDIDAAGGLSVQSNIWANGDIIAQGGLSAQSNITAQGSISAGGNMGCLGDLSGSNIWATGGIHANGDIGGAKNHCSSIDCGGGAYVGGDVNVEGYSLLNAGFIAKSNSAIMGNFSVVGNFTASGTKAFVQPHPTDPTKEIVYTCLEGPEAGTYVRGSAEMVNGQAVIKLPDHFGMVTGAKGLTVQLTPRGTWLELYVTTATVAQVAVGEAQGRSGQFDYLVQGVRKGYENQPVVRDRRTVGAKP